MNRFSKNNTQPKPISGVIGKIIQSLGMTSSYNGWQVVSHWSEIVGSEIAGRAKAIRFDSGILFVAVNDDSWRQEISMKADEILEKIHSFSFGRSVKQIRLIKQGKEI